MAQPTPTYLKVFKEQTPESTRPDLAAIGSLPEVLRAFKRVTGWSLQYLSNPKPFDPLEMTWSVPVDLGAGADPGLLRLDPVGSAGTPSVSHVDPRAVRELASALAGMLGELLQTRRALCQREAELAAGVPLVPQPEPARHLSARLEAVLRAGAEAIGCDAAGLYILDGATTCLKLRSCWKLPPERLNLPPRPLKDALADLEAMLGHAVVVDDRSPLPQWNPPEDFPTSVCVPVATSNTILGTLWLFSNRHRDFSDPETNIVEVVSGRLAAELEREMLLRVAADASRLERQLAAAERLQLDQLPSSAPLLDGWRLAGWTSQAEPLAASFFDWFSAPAGLWAAVAVHTTGCGVAAALVANAVRAALRCHVQYHPSAYQVITHVNRTLWTGSAGDQTAQAFIALLDPCDGRVQYALAGQPLVLLIGSQSWQSLTRPDPLLGASPESAFSRCEVALEPGEILLAVTAGCSDHGEGEARPIDQGELAKELTGHLSLPAQELVTLARDRLEALAPAPTSTAADRSILLIKRA